MLHYDSPCCVLERDRGAMATYLREQFNWKTPEQKEPDIDYARSLLTSPRGDAGMVLYEQYMDRFRQQKPQALPKVKIERGCARLKDCITSLVYDPDNTEVPKKINSTPRRRAPATIPTTGSATS